MNGLVFLIPIALGLGLLGLAAFFWSLGHGQFEDLDGDGRRILLDEDEIDPPAPPEAGADPIKSEK